MFLEQATMQFLLVLVLGGVMGYSLKYPALIPAEASKRADEMLAQIEPADQPASEEIREWLREGGCTPDEVEVEDENGVRWRASTPDGLVVVAKVYQPLDGHTTFRCPLE
jgi:hypothetical protein